MGPDTRITTHIAASLNDSLAKMVNTQLMMPLAYLLHELCYGNYPSHLLTQHMARESLHSSYCSDSRNGNRSSKLGLACQFAESSR